MFYPAPRIGSLIFVPDSILQDPPLTVYLRKHKEAPDFRGFVALNIFCGSSSVSLPRDWILMVVGENGYKVSKSKLSSLQTSRNASTDVTAGAFGSTDAASHVSPKWRPTVSYPIKH